MIFKHITLSLLLLITTCSFIFAQKLALGIKGGLNYSNQTYQEEQRLAQRQGNKWSMKAGIFSEIAFNETFSLAPGLLYNQRGYTTTIVSFDYTNGRYILTGIDKNFKVRTDYLSLDLPLKMIATDGKIAPYLLLGPRIDLLVYGEQKRYLPINKELNKIGAGIVTAFGAEIHLSSKWNLFAEIEYNTTLTSAHQASYRETRNSLFALNTGIKLKAHSRQNHPKSNASTEVTGKFINLKPGLLFGIRHGKQRIMVDEYNSDHLQIGFPYKELRSENLLTQLAFQAKAIPFSGLYLQTSLPSVTDKWSLWIEAQYSAETYKAQRHYQGAEGSITIAEDAFIKTNTLHVPMLLRYTMGKTKIRHYLQTGISCNFALNKNNQLKRTLWDESGQVYYQGGSELFNMRTKELAAVAGAGVQHCFTKGLRYYAEVRGTAGNGYAATSSASSLKVLTSSLALHMGVGF
jgi:hypothetical protein